MLGEKLKELRNQKVFLQSQVVAELDVPSAFFSKIENKGKLISKACLCKKAHFNSVEDQQLLTLLVSRPSILKLLKANLWQKKH